MPKSSPIRGREFPAEEAERKQRELGVSGASLESVPRKMRRRFSASEKLRIVKAAEAAVASGVRGALEKLLRKEGIYRVVTPDALVDELKGAGGDAACNLHPLVGGMPIEAGWDSLRLYCEQVLPKL